MPLSPGKVPADVHIHRHSGNCEEELSGKYATYIEDHRNTLMAKCERINDCIEGLLVDENILSLLQGDNLSLNRTCGLIFEDNLEDGIDLGKCKAEDRDDIREDLQEHLVLQFEDVKASGWRNVRKCLDTNYGKKERTTYVEEICMLAKKKKQICENPNIHKNVTTFFNNQIQHLQCTCRSLHASDDKGESKSSVPVVVGCLVGGLILFLLIIALIFCIYRRRRKARKSKKSKNVIYLPAAKGDYPVYQEVGDDRGYGAGNPPTLPVRYGKYNEEDESAYLEPVEAGFKFRPKAPFPGKSNPYYGSPPEYTERDASNNVSTTDRENGYFQPLPVPPEVKHQTENTSGYETIRDEMMTEDVPQPPIPAKRGSNNEEATRYVTLEKDIGVRRVNSTV